MNPVYRALPWLLPAIHRGSLQQTVRQCQWLVIDCESTGLDPRKDRLLEVASVPVTGRVISLADSFEGVLKQDSASSIANILIHGISGQRQLSGESPTTVMNRIGDKLQGRIAVGFHAAFDRELCRRALHRFVLRRLTGDWLDLADLAPALIPSLADRCRTLDDWLSALYIDVSHRHTAAGDALASAQLLIKLLALVPDNQPVKALFKSASVHRDLALQKSAYR